MISTQNVYTNSNTNNMINKTNIDLKEYETDYIISVKNSVNLPATIVERKNKNLDLLKENQDLVISPVNLRLLSKGKLDNLTMNEKDNLFDFDNSNIDNKLNLNSFKYDEGFSNDSNDEVLKTFINTDYVSNIEDNNYNKEYGSNNKFIEEILINKNVNENLSLETFRQEALINHNRKRINHQVGILKTSEVLEREAQEWAEHLAKNEEFNKKNLVISGEEIGENIACFSNFKTGQNLTEEWYEEIKKYDYENPKKKSSNVNFTQMVWKDTKEVGFGYQKSKSGYYYIVSFYFPRGNIEGLYEKNVFPLLRKI